MKTISLATLAVLALASPALGQSADAPISTAVHPEEGEYLVSGSGFALYLFLADTQGAEGTPPVSACEDECLGNWPAVTVEGDVQGDDKVNAELLGTFERSDGTMQVTYNGWPLYTYVKDTETTDINGHDIEEFGAEWYLVGPDGNRLEDDGGGEGEGEGEDEGADNSGSGGGNSGEGGNSGSSGGGY